MQWNKAGIFGSVAALALGACASTNSETRSTDAQASAAPTAPGAPNSSAPSDIPQGKQPVMTNAAPSSETAAPGVAGGDSAALGGELQNRASAPSQSDAMQPRGAETGRRVAPAPSASASGTAGASPSASGSASADTTATSPSASVSGSTGTGGSYSAGTTTTDTGGSSNTGTSSTRDSGGASAGTYGSGNTASNTSGLSASGTAGTSAGRAPSTPGSMTNDTGVSGSAGTSGVGASGGLGSTGATASTGLSGSEDAASAHRHQLLFGANEKFDVKGKLSAVNAQKGEITIQRDNLPPALLKVEPQTKIQLDGRQSSLNELRPGGDVRASFNLSGRRPIAIEVNAKAK